MIVTHLTMKEINQKIIEWSKSIIKLRKKEKDIKNKIMNLLKIKILKKKKNQCIDLKIHRQPILKKFKMKTQIPKKNYH